MNNELHLRRLRRIDRMPFVRRHAYDPGVASRDVPLIASMGAPSNTITMASNGDVCLVRP